MDTTLSLDTDNNIVQTQTIVTTISQDDLAQGLAAATLNQQVAQGVLDQANTALTDAQALFDQYNTLTAQIAQLPPSPAQPMPAQT